MLLLEPCKHNVSRGFDLSGKIQILMHDHVPLSISPRIIKGLKVLYKFDILWITCNEQFGFTCCMYVVEATWFWSELHLKWTASALIWHYTSNIIKKGKKCYRKCNFVRLHSSYKQCTSICASKLQWSLPPEICVKWRREVGIWLNLWYWIIQWRTGYDIEEAWEFQRITK